MDGNGNKGIGIGIVILLFGYEMECKKREWWFHASYILEMDKFYITFIECIFDQ